MRDRLTEYKELGKKIRAIYKGTCVPCMSGPAFNKLDCSACDVMEEYKVLQKKKAAIFGGVLDE